MAAEVSRTPRRRWLAFLPSVLFCLYFGWRLSPRSMPPFDDPGTQPLAVGPGEVLPDAAAVLARVREAYASARTYRDQGAIRNERVEDGERELVSIERFRVALERPDRLAWQWREVSRRRFRQDECVRLLQDGDVLRFESRKGGEVLLENRPDALARVSWHGESAHLQLLFPGEIAGRPLLEGFGEPRVVGIERVGTQLCYRLESRWTQGDETEAEHVLWVDVETHLLRRGLTRLFLDDWTSESTFLFAPEADVTLEPDELALLPAY